MTLPQAPLDAVAAALAAVDSTGQVLAVNAAFAQLTGWTADALIGRRIDAVCTAASVAAMRKALTRPDSADAVELECRHTAGGEVLPVRMQVRKAGSTVWLTFVDRRDELGWRDRAEHADELLTMVQDFGRLGIWERDVRTLQGRWDRHVHRFWGLDPDAGTPDFAEASQRIVAEDREPFRATFLDSMRRVGACSFRYRVNGADGQLRRLHSQWEVKPGADGRPQRAIGIMTDDTEVWRLARSVDEAQAQLTLALELGRIAVWRHDLGENRLYYNNQGWRLLGLEPQPQGFSLDQVRQLIHPDDLPQVRAAMDQSLKSSSPVDMEARYRHADGHWLDILTRRVTQRDEAGRPVAFLGVAIDMSEQLRERRRAEQLARRLDLAATASGVGIWSYDFERRDAHWNAQMYALHGLSPDEPAPDWPSYLRTYFVEEQRADIAARVDAMVAASTDKVVRADLRIVRSDGTPRELSVRVRVIRDEGRPQMIGAMTDVTEQRAEQRALRDAHTRVALAARAVGVGIWEADRRTGEAIWDEQMWRLRGLEPRGTRAPDHDERYALVHPDDVPTLQHAYSETNITNRPTSVEFRVRWPDGSWHWLASRSTPISDEQGHEVRRIGVNWDITEARQAEQTHQAQLAAQRESQAKSALLARMSHELRTPLHAVIGFAQLLQADESLHWHADARERVGHIRSAGQHLLALVDDVLDLSSLDAGDAPLELRRQPLCDAFDAVLPMVAAQAETAGVSIACHGLDHAVQADPTRLRQILLNLLTNAIKYNRPGGQVDISAASTGSDVVITVSDTGRGMNAEQLAHVFEPFNRLGVEREGIEGSGIGLAIVKINVERMGGQVVVSSEPDKGSRFEVRLPAAAPASDDTQTSGAPAGAPAAARNGHARVLYIEDNPVNALIVRELIAQRRDLQLDEAADGCSGIERARAAPPNLILLDMQLPDIDGLEVLRRLRADAATAAIPCIALSANAMPDDIQTALGAGFTDYWTKPLDFRVFMSALDSLFGKAA